MSSRKFLKNLSILSIFALILTTIGYGTYVYADKYTWTSLSTPTTDWQAVAVSSGTYAYAAKGGFLYISTDGGIIWSVAYNFGAQYVVRSIATSNAGDMVLVSLDEIGAGSTFGVSSNYGGNFSFPAPYASEWQGVAMSEHGQYLYVADETNNRLIYSHNFGSTWNNANSLSYAPVAVTTSNTGQHVYTVPPYGYPTRSDDYGLNHNATGFLGYYRDIAASANGQYVYAVPQNSGIQYSSDYGQSYTALANPGSFDWKSISVSGDGSRVVAVTMTGALYSSRDFGATFTQEAAVSTSVWNDVSLSSDGYIALLASSDAYLWTGNWDVVAPSIANVFSLSSNGTYKAGQTVQMQINFSEPLYTSTVNLTLETGSIDRACQTGGIAAGATSATCIYTVQVGDVTSDLSTNAIADTLTDDAGNQRTDHSAALGFLASNQTIAIDAVVPVVSLTAPSNGSTASSTVSLTATASDVGIGLVGVQFRAGTTSIGVEDTSSPYAVSWDSTAVADGSHTLYAVARDAAGNYATSSVTITVDNTAPAAPGTPDLVTSSDIGDSSSDDFTSTTTPQFTSSCQVITGSSVNFYSGVNQIGTASCVSGVATTTSSTLTAGSHSIIAKQIDAIGNISASSSALTVIIDTTGPSVSLTSPTTGATVNGTISIDATATDSLTSVTGVLFSHGTTTIGSEDTSSPYSVSLDTTTLPDGTYTLNAVARDVVGNYATSSVSVTIATPAPSSSGSTQSSGPTAYSTPPSAPIPGIYNPVTTTVTSSGGNEIVSPTKALASAIVQSTGVTSSFKFTKNATIRTINDEVINLQRMLNTMGYTVSTSGAGSKGRESFFFGPKTRLALIRFQRAFAIPATGFFGPLSRAAMNRILNSIQ